MSFSDLIESGKDGGSLGLIDVLYTDEDMFEQAHFRSETQRLGAILQEVLTDRELQIISWWYRLDEKSPLTQHKVVSMLSISRNYVSGLKNTVLQKLRKALKTGKEC